MSEPITPESPRPFASMPDMPDDMDEAFQSFKLAILRQRLAQWPEISAGDVAASLEALKRLAMAPAEAVA